MPHLNPDAAALGTAVLAQYDDRMKRITISLPDELAERVKRSAGGEGQVSSYIAAALTDFEDRESLGEILDAWHLETPVPDALRREIAAELDEAGLPDRRPPRTDRS